MGADATLLVALLVPLMLGGLFAVAFGLYMGLLGPDGGGVMMRHAPVLYAGFLVVPLSILALSPDGLTLLGDWFALPLGVDALFLPAAVVVGIALFRAEVWAASGFLLLMRRRRDLRTTVEGGSSSLGDSGLNGAGVTVAVIVISAGEEIIWRGFVLEGSQAAWSLGPAAAVALAAATFGLNHWYFGLQNVVLKTFSGVIWGILTVASGTLWAAVISHTVFSLWAIARLRRQGREREGELLGGRDSMRVPV